MNEDLGGTFGCIAHHQMPPNRSGLNFKRYICPDDHGCRFIVRIAISLSWIPALSDIWERRELSQEAMEEDELRTGTLRPLSFSPWNAPPLLQSHTKLIVISRN